MQVGDFMRKELKETLTIENISFDYKKHLIDTIKKSISLLLIFSAFGVFWSVIIFSIQKSSDLGYKFLIICGGPIWLCLLLLVYAFLTTPIKEYREYLLISKGEYRLVEDQLIGKEAPSPRLTLVASSVPYIFYFKSYGEYSFLGGQYYTFSKSYTMNDFSLYRSADESDAFFLLLNKNNQILFAYNKKFFNIEELN